MKYQENAQLEGGKWLSVDLVTLELRLKVGHFYLLNHHNQKYLHHKCLYFKVCNRNYKQFKISKLIELSMLERMGVIILWEVQHKIIVLTMEEMKFMMQQIIRMI